MKKTLIGLLALSILLFAAGCNAQQAVEDAPAAQPPPEEVVTPIPPSPVPETGIPEPEQTPPPESVPPGEPPETTGPTAEPEIPEESKEPEGTEPPEDIPALPPAEEVVEPEAETPPVSTEESSVIPLPILMYHHVVPDGTECNDMTVTVSKLAGDLQWLTEHGYNTILPRDLAAGTPLPEKPVLITFDDGYRSNYELAYPLFQQYQTKAVISIMVRMQDINVSSFLSWDMCREMAASGLVEIGSHAYRLHNLDERSGNFTPGGINGVQRKPDESDEDFRVRVLDDLQRSHDLIEEQLGQDVTFFAYPFGIREPDAEALINELFPVTVVTATGTTDLSKGIQNMTRWTVSMNTSLASVLES